MTTMINSETSVSHRPGLTIAGGVRSGRDPRNMTRSEFAEMGHTETSPIKAIRAKCVDCCAGELAEVRHCAATACPLWPFRMGVNPLNARHVGRARLT